MIDAYIPLLCFLLCYIEMGTNHQFSSLALFIYRPNRCSMVQRPVPSSGQPLKGSALTFVPGFIRALPPSGYPPEEAGPETPKHLFCW